MIETAIYIIVGLWMLAIGTVIVWKVPMPAWSRYKVKYIWEGAQRGFLFAMVAVCFLLAVVGCGSDSAPAPTPIPEMTVAEYVAEICEPDSGIDPLNSSWGEYSDYMAGLVSRLEGISPPSELEDYHRLTLKASKALAEHVAKFPREDAASPFELVTTELIAIANEGEAAKAQLSEATQAALDAGGC